MGSPEWNTASKVMPVEGVSNPCEEKGESCLKVGHAQSSATPTPGMCLVFQQSDLLWEHGARRVPACKPGMKWASLPRGVTKSCGASEGFLHPLFQPTWELFPLQVHQGQFFVREQRCAIKDRSRGAGVIRHGEVQVQEHLRNSVIQMTETRERVCRWAWADSNAQRGFVQVGVGCFSV